MTTSQEPAEGARDDDLPAGADSADPGEVSGTGQDDTTRGDQTNRPAFGDPDPVEADELGGAQTDAVDSAGS